MGLSSESACASLESLRSRSFLHCSSRNLREISVENSENGPEKAHMSTKELLKQCLAQVVQQISLFNETLKQTKKNGNISTQNTPTAGSLGKPVKRRGRPPGSKNKAALSIPSFHDLHNTPELNLRTHTASYNDTDSAADADGTGTDASGTMVEEAGDRGRMHGSPRHGDASSVISDDCSQSDDGKGVNISYDDRIKELTSKYEVSRDPAKPTVFLVYKILEMLGKGPVNEKALRTAVVDSCKDAGIRTTGRTSAATADYNLAISVMKGVQLVCEREDHTLQQHETVVNTESKQDHSNESISKTVYENWPEIINHFILVITNKRAELASQATAAATAVATVAASPSDPGSGSGSVQTPQAAATPSSGKDSGAVPSVNETKVAQSPSGRQSPLGLPLTPVDWQLSLLDPQTLSQMMQCVHQMSRQADQYLTHRPRDNRLPPGLDTLLGLKDSPLHTDMVLEELLRQMSLPLSMPASTTLDPATLASVAEAHNAVQQAAAATSHRLHTATSAATNGENKTPPATDTSTENSIAVSSTETEIVGTKSNIKAERDTQATGHPMPSTSASSDQATSRKRPLRSFELSAPVENIVQNADTLLQSWGQVCYEEAKLLEEEEALFHRLAKRCGLSLPSLQSQTQTLRLGTKYLNADNQVQARPLLWDGVPLTASLLWERARKAKRQRVHNYGNSPTYSRSDDGLPPLPGHSSGFSSFTPPFLSRKRSGATNTSDYPSHHVPPMRLHPSVPFIKEIPRDHTQPIELPDLTIRSCVVPWSDIAKEFTPLRAPLDGTPVARDDTEAFTFPDSKSEDGSRSEDTSDATVTNPSLKRQRSEVLAPTFRVVTKHANSDQQEEQQPAAAQEESSTNKRIAGGYRIAVASPETVETGSDSDSEEDISDEAVAARHEVVLQRMRDRYKKLQEMKNKQQEHLSITAPQGPHSAGAASTVTSPKKGRKGKGKSQRSHGRSHSKTIPLPQQAAPPPPTPEAFSMPFAKPSPNDTTTSFPDPTARLPIAATSTAASSPFQR